MGKFKAGDGVIYVGNKLGKIMNPKMLGQKHIVLKQAAGDGYVQLERDINVKEFNLQLAKPFLIKQYTKHLQL